MSKKSTKTTCHPLTSFAGAFHAKTSAKPAKGRAWLVTAPGCTSKCSGLFARCSQDFGSWKTSQLSLTGGLMSYSEPWPRQGMMLDGDCFGHQPWVPHKEESDGFASGGWPTPTAALASGGQISRGGKRKGELLLAGMVKNGAPIGVNQLNPDWVELLQGFPPGWTSLHQDGRRRLVPHMIGSPQEPTSSNPKTVKD